jgi:hypothetical protein
MAAAAVCRRRSAIGVYIGNQQTRPEAETCGCGGKDERGKKEKCHVRSGGRVQEPAGR